VSLNVHSLWLPLEAAGLFLHTTGSSLGWCSLWMADLVSKWQITGLLLWWHKGASQFIDSSSQHNDQGWLHLHLALKDMHSFVMGVFVILLAVQIQSSCSHQSFSSDHISAHKSLPSSMLHKRCHYEQWLRYPSLQLGDCHKILCKNPSTKLILMTPSLIKVSQHAYGCLHLALICM